MPVLLGLASCKDSIPQPDFSKTTPIVELAVASLAGNGGGNSMTASFAIQTTPSDFYIIVNYAASDANANDVKVTLAVDTAVMGKYNRANATAYEVLPIADYNLSTTVTIPKGQRKVEYHMTFNTTLINPSAKYDLPLKIIDASGNTISGNFGTLNLLVGVKNAYDADYTTTGYFFHPANPRPLSGTRHLGTAGLNSCIAELADYAGSDYYFQFDIDSSNKLTNWKAVHSTNDAGLSGFMTADNPSNVKYEIGNNSGAGVQLPGQGEWLSSKYNNTYDATAKTFYMHYGYNGTGPADFSRQTYEKWVRN